MNKLRAVFSKTEYTQDVYVAQLGKLNSMAIRLSDGSLCLYSPVAGLGEAEHLHLNDLGGVSTILAPNHYHNKGLKEHVTLFPDAALVCSAAAKPRLEKVTGLGFECLDALTAKLPAHMQILEPQGLKTGEVWLQIRENPEVIWIVTDAFSARSNSKPFYAESPTLLGTFPKYGVKDPVVYKNWLETTLAFSEPTLIFPCHGSPIKAQNLGSALIKLFDETF